MKLSDIKGERTLDVFADLIQPVAALAEDPDVTKLFKKQAPPEGVDARTFMISRIKVGLPALLKKHKKNFIFILSTIEGITPEEYVIKMTLSSLLSDVLELLTDKAFEEFF